MKLFMHKLILTRQVWFLMLRLLFSFPGLILGPTTHKRGRPRGGKSLSPVVRLVGKMNKKIVHYTEEKLVFNALTSLFAYLNRLFQCYLFFSSLTLSILVNNTGLVYTVLGKGSQCTYQQPRAPG